jgi:hypothetical protein
MKPTDYCGGSFFQEKFLAILNTIAGLIIRTIQAASELWFKTPNMLH